MSRASQLSERSDSVATSRQTVASRDVTHVTRDGDDPVTLAAVWLAEQDGTMARPIPTLQQRFNLTAKQACDACALAARMRTLRRAFA
jgi:hypothetical protein